jgi:hypothetical protein
MDVGNKVRRWTGIGLAATLVLGMSLPAGAQSLDDLTGAVGQVAEVTLRFSRTGRVR